MDQAQPREPPCTGATPCDMLILRFVCIAARKILEGVRNCGGWKVIALQKEERKKQTSFPFSGERLLLLQVSRSSSFLAWINHDGIHAHSPANIFLAFKSGCIIRENFFAPPREREKEKRDRRFLSRRRSVHALMGGVHRGFLAPVKDHLKN